MRVILINPPSPFLADTRRQPPLGLLYIATMFEAHGARVRVLDYCLKDYGEPPEGYDIYGFTATTPQYPYALELAKNVEGYKVIGGPHVSAVNQTDEIWDAVVKGEGENSIPSIMLSYRARKKVTIRQKLIEDLDLIPFPARHLVDLKKYTRQVEGKLAASLICSRGCVFNCAFCDMSVFGRRIRFRSIQNIMAEIDDLRERYRYKALQFLDDSITVNRNWIIELCKELKSRNVIWRCWTRVDIVDFELLKLMHDAGCVYIAFGIESGSNRILKSMNKGTTVKQGIQAIKWAKRADITVKAFLMAGFPTETQETIAETIEFVEKTNPDEWILDTFTPMPGSDTYRYPEKYGIKSLSNNPSQYIHADSEGKGRLPFNPLNTTREELERLRDILLDYLKKRKGGPI